MRYITAPSHPPRQASPGFGRRNVGPDRFPSFSATRVGGLFRCWSGSEEAKCFHFTFIIAGFLAFRSLAKMATHDAEVVTFRRRSKNRVLKRKICTSAFAPQSHSDLEQIDVFVLFFAGCNIPWTMPNAFHVMATKRWSVPSSDLAINVLASFDTFTN